MIHRNRQVSLSFLFLFLSVLVTAQTSYGTIPNPPDFDSAIPVSKLLKQNLKDLYSPLPEDQVWTGKKIENWNQFFATDEKVEVKFYYQKSESDQLIFQNKVPVFHTKPFWIKIQNLGFTYVVLEGQFCKVILKYSRTENGICQYQSSVCIPVNVNVDFEPDLNLVQTIPLHLEKQNSDSAFISAKLEKNTADWKLKFWSSEVEILDFVELDDYGANFNSQFLNDTLIVSFSNVSEVEGILNLQEQLISTLNIQQ